MRSECCPDFDIVGATRFRRSSEIRRSVAITINMFSIRAGQIRACQRACQRAYQSIDFKGVFEI